MSEPTIRADRLRSRRQELQLSQEQLAERSGVTQSTVSQSERNEQVPTIRSLVLLAHSLGVSVEWLLGMDPPDSVSRVENIDDLEAEVITLFRQVDPARRHELADVVRAIVKLMMHP